jgi:hypothetical protein
MDSAGAQTSARRVSGDSVSASLFTGRARTTILRGEEIGAEDCFGRQDYRLLYHGVNQPIFKISI